MNESKAESTGTAKGAWWNDPKVSNFLMMLTYAFGGAGVAAGIYGLTQGGGPKAVHYALPLAVGAVGILALLRHSVFHISDARRAGIDSDPFYMIELGFCNGAIGIAALFAFFSNWGVTAEAILMLVYSLYLGSSFFIFLTRTRSGGIDGGKIFALCMWVMQVGFMFYFGIAAAIAYGV